jgi:tRNA A37 threonylcarbamoyladenosine modification protein TsaB
LIEVLVISISKPLLIGIYENKELIKEYKLEGKTSDLLPSLFSRILKEFNIKRINYVNSPGSYMAIKVAYIFLKTISISKKIEFMACNGFEFNQNSPIKALGKKYFIQDLNEIKVDFLEKDDIIRDFELPNSIDKINFNKQTLPIYNLPAV